MGPTVSPVELSNARQFIDAVATEPESRMALLGVLEALRTAGFGAESSVLAAGFTLGVRAALGRAEPKR